MLFNKLDEKLDDKWDKNLDEIARYRFCVQGVSPYLFQQSSDRFFCFHSCDPLDLYSYVSILSFDPLDLYDVYLKKKFRRVDPFLGRGGHLVHKYGNRLMSWK